MTEAQLTGLLLSRGWHDSPHAGVACISPPSGTYYLSERATIALASVPTEDIPLLLACPQVANAIIRPNSTETDISTWHRQIAVPALQAMLE